MSPNSLAAFAHQKYLSLETYRKTGTPVATPVWFAKAHGTLYIYSLANAGKVKRIRNNPKVRIVPCDRAWPPQGGMGRRKSPDTGCRGAAHGHQLLNQKYGWMKRIGDLFSRLRRKARVVITIDIV